jgi:hypothetical protein
LDDKEIEDEGREHPQDNQKPKPIEGDAGKSLNDTQLNEDGERRKGKRRSKTIALKRLSREEIRQGIELADWMGYRRPSNRTECVNGVRPCPFVACKHHLYLDVNPDTGSIKLNFPDVPVWDMEETCALDIADRGGVTLEEVGEILNLTRERIRQVEVIGLEKLRETSFSKQLEGSRVFDDE